MVTDEEVYEKIKFILLKAFKIDKSLVQKNSKLEEDLGLDSIELMDAMCFVEAEFKIRIVRKSLANMQFPLTINDLIELISQKIRDKTEISHH